MDKSLWNRVLLILVWVVAFVIVVAIIKFISRFHVFQAVSCFVRDLVKDRGKERQTMEPLTPMQSELTSKIEALTRSVDELTRNLSLMPSELTSKIEALTRSVDELARNLSPMVSKLISEFEAHRRSVDELARNLTSMLSELIELRKTLELPHQRRHELVSESKAMLTDIEKNGTQKQGVISESEPKSTHKGTISSEGEKHLPTEETRTSNNTPFQPSDQAPRNFSVGRGGNSMASIYEFSPSSSEPTLEPARAPEKTEPTPRHGLDLDSVVALWNKVGSTLSLDLQSFSREIGPRWRLRRVPEQGKKEMSDFYLLEDLGGEVGQSLYLLVHVRIWIDEYVRDFFDADKKGNNLVIEAVEKPAQLPTNIPKPLDEVDLRYLWKMGVKQRGKVKTRPG